MAVSSTLFGIPIGVYLLTAVPEAIVKAILAVVILAFSLHSILAKGRYKLSNDRLAWLFGFQAGIFGGAYGMNGPPLAVYGSLRGWRPEQFRATLQAYFLPASIAGMGGYYLADLWTLTVNQFYLASLPPVVLASLGGRSQQRQRSAARCLLRRRRSASRFRPEPLLRGSGLGRSGSKSLRRPQRCLPRLLPAYCEPPGAHELGDEEVNTILTIES